MPDGFIDKTRSPLDTCLLILFVLVFSGSFLMFAWRPLGEPDFWWHLKTGELIFEGRRLLHADPFNFTSDPSAVTFLERVILKAYWLWQVVAYGFYLLAGYAGIKLLNGLTLLATYALMSCSMLRHRVRLPVALPLMMISLFIYARLYRLERPQIMTFLFATLLVVLFLKVRSGERPSPWLYPLMVCWANMHGGVVVGVALLVVFAAGSFWDFRNSPGQWRHIVLWCGLGVLVSLLNPNGHEIYLLALGMASTGNATTVAEFASPYEWLVNKPWLYIPFMAVLVAHVWALFSGWRRHVATDWFMSIAVIATAVMFARNLAFVVVSLMPLTAVLLHEALDARGRAFRRRETWVGIAIVAMLAGGVAIDVTRGKLWRGAAWPLVDDGVAPQALGRFLDDAALQGNLFNQYGWGGYLLWTLYPEYKLFIDGRNLHGPEFYDEYLKIREAAIGDDPARPEYQKLLDKYRIDYVVMPNQTYRGYVQVLMKYLLTDRNWQPIYLDEHGFVLARYKSETAEIIGRHTIDKVAFLNSLLSCFTDRIKQNPGRADTYLGRGELFGYMGRYAEAEQDFAVAQKLDPANDYLPLKVRQVQKLKELDGLAN